MPPGYQGCQGGLAINVEATTGSPVVKITNNSVRNYDKNGITASGPGAHGGPNVTVSGNTIIGLGATPVIAQNGIQIGYGASGSVSSNYVADDIYTGGLRFLWHSDFRLPRDSCVRQHGGEHTARNCSGLVQR